MLSLISIQGFDAQNLFPKWAHQLTGDGRNTSNAIAVSSGGEVFVTGRFRGMLDLDPGPATYTFQTGSLGYEPYIVKLDSTGNFSWGCSFRSVNTPSQVNECIGIVTSVSGDIYVSGHFAETLDFDPGSSTFTMQPAQGCYFVCKLTSAGQFVWAKQFGPAASTGGCFMTIDQQGDLVLSGAFVGQADFDPGPNQYLMNAVALEDIFVTKLNSNGAFIWAFQIGGAGYDGVSALATDNSDNIFAGFRFKDTVDFDPGTGNYLLSAASGSVVLSKFSATGNLIFAGQMEVLGINQLKPDAAGQLYLTGSFSGTADISPGAGTYSVVSTGSSDVFLCRLDNSGNLLWGRSFGGTNSDGGNALCVEDMDVYVTGKFEGVADFFPGVSVFTLAASGPIAGYISRFDTTGQFHWAAALGGSDMAYGMDIASAPGHQIVVAGPFRDTCDMDPGSGVYNLISAPNQLETFIAKFAPCNNCGVGVYEHVAGAFKVYPNPFYDLLYVETDQQTELRVYDVLGNKILDSPVSHGKNSIRLGDQPPGIYFLTITGRADRIKIVRQ